MIKGVRYKDLLVIILAVLLTILFYFINPLVFLEKLGYATLAILALLELIGLAQAKVSE